MELDIARETVRLLEAKVPFSLVATLATRGSSPRHAGAWMLVREDGSFRGTVGGGPLEARAIELARETLSSQQARLLEFVLTDADAAGLGMICGGEGVLLIEPVDPGRAPAARDLFAAVVALLETGGTGWLVTEVTPAARAGGESAAGGAAAGGAAGEAAAGEAAESVAVRRCLVDESGRITGDLVLPAGALEALRRSGTLDGLTGPDRPGFYVQPVGVPGTAYVFGAGHCGRSLVPLLGMVGFRTVVVDDRPDFAHARHFPDADEIVVPASFEGSLAGMGIDRRSYIIIMTRGHVLDRIVLEQALRTDACYIGMIGSKKKIAGIFAALRERGFTDADLARVHAPIGLEIGAETPEEIAVSIAAQVVQIRRGLSR